jgi:pimeloyl-ACP methyl ester carboxylesterase
MANGHQYWNARDIKVPVLLVCGSADFWSRPEDVIAYEKDLIHCPRKKSVIIPDGTHFIFLDKPEKGREKLIEEIVSFAKQ